MENWISLYINFLICFILSSFICYIIDINSTLIKYKNRKIIEYKNQQTDIDFLIFQYKFITPRVVINVLGVVPLFFMNIISNCKFDKNFKYYELLYILLAGWLIDIFFYTSHRILHNPVLYKWSHKIHHRFKNPVGMEAVYHHWFDLCFGNILPIFLSLWILPSKNIFIWHIWISLSTCFTILKAHSGWLDDDHSKHHKLYNICYGTSLFMDKFFDTKYIDNV